MQKLFNLKMTEIQLMNNCSWRRGCVGIKSNIRLSLILGLMLFNLAGCTSTELQYFMQGMTQGLDEAGNDLRRQNYQAVKSQCPYGTVSQDNNGRYFCYTPRLPGSTGNCGDGKPGVCPEG